MTNSNIRDKIFSRNIMGKEYEDDNTYKCISLLKDGIYTNRGIFTLLGEDEWVNVVKRAKKSVFLY